MITKQQVEHIAKLARIQLKEKEIGKFRKELSSILDYFDLLKKADTSKTEPTFHIYPVKSRRAGAEQFNGVKENLKIMREDRAEPEEPKVVNKLIESGPDKKERHFKVKAVF